MIWCFCEAVGAVDRVCEGDLGQRRLQDPYRRLSCSALCRVVSRRRQAKIVGEI